MPCACACASSPSPQGYGTKAANVTSWGGNTIYDDATKK